MRRGLTVLLHSGPRYWTRALAWGVVFAAALAIPTGLVANPIFDRMTAPAWWSYVIWVLVAMAGGAAMAMRAHPAAQACPVQRRAAAGGGLAYLAVACPLCNKAVVLALGSSGALSYFAPAQPWLGVVALMSLLPVLARLLRLIGRGSMRLYPAGGHRDG
jgi:hypothetical protein